MLKSIESVLRRYSVNTATITGVPALHESLQVRQPGEIINIKQLIRNWATIPAVGFNSVLKLPVHKFERTVSVGDAGAGGWVSGSSDVVVGDVIVPNDVFGVPLRKDLAFRGYMFHRHALAGYQETMQLHEWEWVGRNAKHRKQLQTGKSRMGRRKAPGKYEGVFAHPLRPKDWRQGVNRRVIHSALKVMLSAKFAQGQIRVVDSLNLESHKTKNLVVHLRNLLGNHCNSVLCVHEGRGDVNDNFRWASAHLPQVRRENIEGVNVYVLAKYRQVLITEKALGKLIYSIQNYPQKMKWVPVCATPTGEPATPPKPVPGWNKAWNERRHKLLASEYRGKILHTERRNWKWSPLLRGALKIPANDSLNGFRVKHQTLFEETVDNQRFEFQELFADDEPLGETDDSLDE